MNWFERHLNWSLFLGLIYLPFNVSFTIGLIVSIVIFAIAFIKVGGGFSLLALVAILAEFVDIASQVQTITVVVSLIVTAVLVILLTSWFLDRKGRSKAFVILFMVSWVIGVFGLLNERNFIGGYLIIAAFAGNILSLIVLLRLGNETAAFDTELLTSQRLDMEQFGASDDWQQPKELDYSPAKNVMDMVDAGDVKDVRDVKDVTDVGDVSAAGIAGEEAPAEEKVMEKAVSAERLKMPILLDDAGAVITCFYHPGADAVNLCSRCKQYVCSECSYVTGTNPICRNCWEKRAESPIIAVPAEKQKGVEPSRPKKQKDVESGKGEQQKTAASGKSERPKSKKNEWLGEFMALYEQASPIINVVTRKSADGMPASPLDLMEGLKLRPMLELAKKLSKPKEKELREAKNEFEQVLSSCIKIADAAADFVSGGGQALLGGPDFARIVDGIETANGLMGKLSQRLTAFSQSQD